MKKIHAIPTLKDNYTYVIETSAASILVDCGEAAPVIDFLERHNLPAPSHILCTHHHSDHIDGFSELKKKFPTLEIIAPEKDRTRIPLTDTGVRDGESLNIGGITIECVETRGHTLNHICYYVPEFSALFTGDTLFSLGCGRLFEGTPADMFASLEKIKKFPDETLLYFGHEYALANLAFSLGQSPVDTDLLQRQTAIAENASPPSFVGNTLGEEKKTSLFLRARSVEDFAELRSARNNF